MSKLIKNRFLALSLVMAMLVSVFSAIPIVSGAEASVSRSPFILTPKHTQNLEPEGKLEWNVDVNNTRSSPKLDIMFVINTEDNKANILMNTAIALSQLNSSLRQSDSNDIHYGASFFGNSDYNSLWFGTPLKLGEYSTTRIEDAILELPLTQSNVTSNDSLWAYMRAIDETEWRPNSHRVVVLIASDETEIRENELIGDFRVNLDGAAALTTTNRIQPVMMTYNKTGRGVKNISDALGVPEYIWSSSATLLTNMRNSLITPATDMKDVTVEAKVESVTYLKDGAESNDIAITIDSATKELLVGETDTINLTATAADKPERRFDTTVAEIGYYVDGVRIEYATQFVKLAGDVKSEPPVVNDLEVILNPESAKVGDDTVIDISAKIDIDNFYDEVDDVVIRWNVKADDNVIFTDDKALTEADLEEESVSLGTFTPDTSSERTYVVSVEIISDDEILKYKSVDFQITKADVKINSMNLILNQELNTIDVSAEIDIENFDEEVDDVVIRWNVKDDDEIVFTDDKILTDSDLEKESVHLGIFTPDTPEEKDYVITADVISNGLMLTQSGNNNFAFSPVSEAPNVVFKKEFSLILSQPFITLGDDIAIDVSAEIDIENFDDVDDITVHWRVEHGGEVVFTDDKTLTDTDLTGDSVYLGSFAPDASDEKTYIVIAQIISNGFSLKQTTANLPISRKDISVSGSSDEEFVYATDDETGVTIKIREERVVDLIFTTSSNDTKLISEYADEIEKIKNELEDLGYFVNLCSVSTSLLTAQDTFAWTEYDHPGYDTQPGYSKHIAYIGNSIRMLGYTSVPYKDFLYIPDNNDSRKLFEFDIQRDATDWHSMQGGGFLFNTVISGDTISGYCVLITQSGLQLYELNRVNLTSFRNTATIGTLRGTFPLSNVYAEHHIKILADSESLSLWSGDNLIINNFALPTRYGYGYGPITSHASHGCSQRSFFTFGNITMETIMGEKLSKILDDYNFASQTGRYVINLSDGFIDTLGTEQEVAEIAQRIIDKNITFIGLGNISNVSQYDALLELITSNGRYYDITADTIFTEISEGIIDAEEIKRAADITARGNPFVATDIVFTATLYDGTIITRTVDNLPADETITLKIPVALSKLIVGKDAVLISDARLTYKDENGIVRVKVLSLNIKTSVLAPKDVTINGVTYSTDITYLNLSDFGLADADIEHLRYLPSLVTLLLNGNQISDIEVLSGLTNLKHLYLNNNQISDITPLSGLKNLTDLRLSVNQIENITPLSGLTALEYLDLSDNQIGDNLAPLSSLKKLQELSLSNNQISDITALSNLTNLICLQLQQNQISDLTALSGLTNLELLYLWDNQISVLTALSGLTNLEVLDLCLNQINDVTPLSGLIRLDDLCLASNQIDEIAPLNGLVNLCDLNLRNNLIHLGQIDALQEYLPDCIILNDAVALPVDTDELEELIHKAKAIMKGGYTDESWTFLQDAILSAVELLADPDIKQLRINNECTSLQAAIEQLEIEEIETDSVVYNNDNSALDYEGNWINDTNSDYMDGNAKFNELERAASVKLTFIGTSVSFIGTKQNNLGDFDVYINGEYQTTINANSPTALQNQELFSIDGLSNGENTIEIRVSDGNYVIVEGFIVS